MSKVVPDGWVNGFIGDYFPKLSTGMTPSRSKPNYFNGNIPWVTSGELNFNVIDSTIESITAEAVKDTNLKVYPKGTILIAITGLEAAGTRGRCAKLGISATVNQSCMTFLENQDVNADYFFQYYLLHGEQFAFKYSQGTKQQSFNGDIVKRLPLPLPPLPEQQKIASILTSVDDVIEKTQSQIHKLQDLKKGTRNELLTRGIGHTEFKDSPVGMIPKGWEVKRLGEVSKVFFSNVDKKSHPDEIPVFLCNYMDVYNNSYIRNGLEFMPATAKQREIDKFLVKQGDVIITKDSETPDDIAVSAYVSEDLDNVLCGYHLALIRADNRKLYGGFLSHLFGLDAIQHHYYQLANGSTRFGLTSDVILDSRISIPPLPEQQKIASILSSMDTNIEEKQNKLQQTKSLKKSLMQDLLTGKVRVSVH